MTVKPLTLNFCDELQPWSLGNKYRVALYSFLESVTIKVTKQQGNNIICIPSGP